MKKIKLGDVFDIETPKGKAYLHYIFEDKTIGSLIRILPGLYSEKPDNFQVLLTSKESFMVFFPLPFAYRKNIVSLVGFADNSNFGKPKYMKTEHSIRKEFIGWHIIDTETWKRVLVKNLTDEQKELSPFEIWNDTLLIENLVNGWNLENWI